MPWGWPGRAGPARPSLTPPPRAERRTCSARRLDICSESPLLPHELSSPDLCCLCIRLEHLQVCCRTLCSLCSICTLCTLCTLYTLCTLCTLYTGALRTRALLALLAPRLCLRRAEPRAGAVCLLRAQARAAGCRVLPAGRAARGG